ncbi:DUF6098 family protein [Leifsonia sp. NPDC058292]|uniref:DUF6098 family protein n=1 Tax=Leifsonia sp. NPDC058292 TaxID=3346428 RepID=UPI0036DDBE44
MLYRLAELEDVLAEAPGLFVRYSRGLAADLEFGALDAESGLELPGLSARPLDPEPWWNRPVRDWLARQVLPVDRLGDLREGVFPWILRGRVVGRGPSGEPLVTDIELVTRLAECLLDEAAGVYRERFGLDPEYAGLLAGAHA